MSSETEQLVEAPAPLVEDVSDEDLDERAGRTVVGELDDAPVDAGEGEEGLDPDLAISVRNVSKAYDIFASPADRLWQAVTRSQTRRRRFWAVRDVSFDVRRGEAWGLIGRNGSGKSTLLQMIAGTLTPTRGTIHVRGRVAALLELGSGFNHRFTGRENVYLSGAILGISKKEMDKRFDEIAAFADLGEFIDQPVHVYSSGMHSRLAFSVAVNVEPDVLILDEVLSVGDAEFQQKSLGRMKQLIGSGLTLLFVSHNADSVKSICGKAVFLKGGRPAFIGSAEHAVDHYFNHVRNVTNRRAAARAEAKLAALPADAGAAAVEVEAEAGWAPPQASLRYGTGHARVERVRVVTAENQPAEAFGFKEPIVIEAECRATVDLDRLDLSFSIRDRAGIDVLGTGAFDEEYSLPPLKAGESTRVRFSVPNILRPGNYGVCLTLARRPDTMGDGLLVLDHLDACAAFTSLADPKRRIKHKVHADVRVSGDEEGREWEDRRGA